MSNLRPGLVSKLLLSDYLKSVEVTRFMNLLDMMVMAALSFYLSADYALK